MIYRARDPSAAPFTLHVEALICTELGKEKHLAITHKGETKKVANEEFAGFVFFGEMIVWP